jgi:hypothetical protein
LLVGLAVLGCGSAHAQGHWASQGDVIGNLGTLHVTATVDQVGTDYTYTYEVMATQIVAPVHTVSIGNPYHVEFTGADNWGASVDFTNPQYLRWMDSVIWVDGVQLNGETAYFTYTSKVEPMLVDVSILNGGHGATGTTLGMAPEPSLGFGLAGALFCALEVMRRRLRH